MGIRHLRRLTMSVSAILLLLASTAGAVVAQEPADIEIDSPIRGLEIEPTRSRVDLDVVLLNHSDDRRTVGFELEGVPEGWDIGVWSQFFDFRISELVVEPTAVDPERLQQVKIRIVPYEPEPGTYSFTLRVTSEDGAVEHEAATYTINVTDAPVEDTGPVSVRSENPALVGEPGSTLGFEIIVGNDSGDEASFSLAHEGPSGWQVTFLEPFGEQRVIGAVSVEDGMTERVRVDVVPPPDVELGEYEVPVIVSSEEGQASIDLVANIVGQGELVATTPTGALSLEARAGGDGTATLLLENPGTADLNDIRMVAEAPEGWDVTFDLPNGVISSLPARHEIAVPVRISPPPDAISGDYIVSVQGTNMDAAAAVDLRVTVTQATIWGWLGIALVVLVVGGMIGLFLKLGRR